jgi:hypothetical protein
MAAFRAGRAGAGVFAGSAALLAGWVSPACAGTAPPAVGLMAATVARSPASSWPGASGQPVPVASAAAAGWRIVSAPRLRPNNALADVAAASKDAAWAVGTEGFNATANVPGTPIILRWNGSRWARAYTGSWKGGIFSVAAASPDSAWALGAAEDGTHEHLLRWNGRSWREVRFPGTPGFYGNLGLTAAGSRAWIIASGEGPPSSQIFGWDGHSWSAQHYACATICTLYAIRARTASDAWAVGNYLTSGATGSTFALHWDGRSWRAVPTPHAGQGYLTDVFASSARNAWAVGAIFDTPQFLLLRWNGTAWRASTVPQGMTAPPLGDTTRITGNAVGQLWVTGVGVPGDRLRYFRYDGRRWTSVLGAAVAGQTSAREGGIAAVPGTTATWSAGVAFVPGLNARERIELYGSLG